MENLESYSDLVNSTFQAVQSENLTAEQIAQQAEQKAEQVKAQVQGIVAPFEAESLREGFGGAINYFKSKATDALKQKGQQLLQKGKQALSDKASELKGQIESKVNELKQRGLDNVEELKGQVGEKIDELTQKGEEFAQKGLSKVNELQSQVEDFGQQAQSKLTDFQNQAQETFDEVGDKVDALQNQAQETFDGIQSQVTEGVDAVKTQASDAVEGLQNQATEAATQARNTLGNVVDKSEYSIEDAGSTPELDSMTDEQASDFMDIVEGRSSLGTSLSNEQFDQATQARQAAVRRGMVQEDPEQASELTETTEATEGDDIFSTSASKAVMQAKETGELPESQMVEGDEGLDSNVAQEVQILQEQRQVASTSEIAEQFGDQQVQAQASEFQDIKPISLDEAPPSAPQVPSEIVDTEEQVGEDVEKDVGDNVAKITAQVGQDAEIATDVEEGASVLDVDPITAVAGLAIAGISMAVENIFDSGHTFIPPQVKFNVSQQLGI